ncbi:MAG: porphobilinogen synthase [Ekhidna sp.]|nr:porphobilinogen synthase [Ekhidna sp.]
MLVMRRSRRNRASSAIRDLVQETTLTPNDFISPLFLLEGTNRKSGIASMPGVFRLSEDLMCEEIEACLKLGIKGFVIFPVVEASYKDKYASKSHDPEFFYLMSLRRIKDKFSKALIITDAAMDPYSSDGHDGVVEGGRILNDETLEILGKMALAQAATGVDMIGPSDMMDFRVSHIRNILDKNGFSETGIISYTAKYASAFYGPFRDALDSAPKFGDKKTYQMNPANSDEAVLEAELDFNEGADVLMVKPALAYLDIIQRLKNAFHIPIAAYNVSGEYSMIKAAAERGWLNAEEAMMESLLAIKRSGADIILTYFAKDAARFLKNQ